MVPNTVIAAWSEVSDRSNQLVLKAATGAPVWQACASNLSQVVPCIEQAHAQSKMGRVVVGYVAYEAAPAFDAALPVKAVAPSTPLAHWLAFEPSQIKDVSPSKAAPLNEELLTPWLDDFGGQWFEESFQKIRDLIEQGEFYQINLTTRLSSTAPDSLDAWALFQHLFGTQAAAHSVYLNLGDLQILSVSPELFFQWDGGTLTTSPMKGTRKPGRSTELALQDNPKDRAENVMIVDLLRNDMARVCQPRTVQVKSLFDVMHLPTVEQMTSTIEGETHDSTQLVDVFKALFPCGSVTGAPKRQAMHHIAGFEMAPRGVYCGAMGVMQPGGVVKMNVPIRTVTLQGGQMTYGVGSGLTWYSERLAERKEWWQKTQFLRDATRDFQILETLRLENGKWVRLDLHLQRMQSAANHFGFVWDKATVVAQLNDAALNNPVGVLMGRLLLNAQGELQVQVRAMPPTPGVVEVTLAEKAFESNENWVQFKTTHRKNYEAFAPKKADVFDTLLFNPQGKLTETCRFNVVFEIENQRLTPRMSTCGAGNLLGGVLRGSLLSENKILEAELTVSDLARVQRAWLINSLRGWVEIDRISNCEGELLYKIAK